MRTYVVRTYSQHAGIVADRSTSAALGSEPMTSQPGLSSRDEDVDAYAGASPRVCFSTCAPLGPRAASGDRGFISSCSWVTVHWFLHVYSVMYKSRHQVLCQNWMEEMVQAQWSLIATPEVLGFEVTIMKHMPRLHGHAKLQVFFTRSDHALSYPSTAILRPLDLGRPMSSSPLRRSGRVQRFI